MDEIMKGTQTYRNHKLVNIFEKLGLIKNFGTGIPRTLDAYKNEKSRYLKLRIIFSMLLYRI